MAGARLAARVSRTAARTPNGAEPGPTPVARRRFATSGTRMWTTGPPEYPRCQSATTSAWGAACFIRVRSHASWIAVSPSQRCTTCEQLVVADALGGLADDGPADVALGGHQVQVLQVAQQADAAGAGAA